MFSKRKILISFFVLFLIIVLAGFGWSAFLNNGSQSTIQIQLDEKKVTMESSRFSFKPIDTKTRNGIKLTDTELSYEVIGKLSKIGDLTITVRKLDNGDQFIFNQFAGTGTLPLQISLNGVDSYDFYDFSEKEPVREHDNTYGVDYVTNVKGLYELKEKNQTKYQLYLSQNIISKELTQSYSDHNKSTLRDFIAEDHHLHISDINNENGETNGIQFELTLKTDDRNQISENWFLFSKEELFSDEEVLESYKNETNHNYLHTPKWNTADGNYTKLPWSIEPGTELGYGRNLVAMQDKTSLKYYQNTKDRFFYDMVLNSINHLENFRKSKDTLWETEYTSTWLKKDYGITAPYTDTRHNENIALFLTQAGKELGIQEIENSYILYADFLSNQKERGNVIETKNGYYIADYFSENQAKKTHVSLNHALGEMNFLLQTYNDSGNHVYLDTALMIKKAVEDTGKGWINPENGDLWYQINADLTFDGNDYPILTLVDLTKSISLFTEMDIPYDPVLIQLIESKIDFIIENKIEVKNTTIEQLKQLGIAEKIYDYSYTTDF